MIETKYKVYIGNFIQNNNILVQWKNFKLDKMAGLTFYT